MAADYRPEDTFVISREFDAPRDLVWKALSEADRLARWWGPKGFTSLGGKLDFRPGGTYHYGHRSPGGQEMWGRFDYREIEPPERMEFTDCFSDPDGGTTRAPFNDTWPLVTLSTLTLGEHDGKTALTIMATPVDATEAEIDTFRAGFGSMREGFSGSMDQLEAYLKEAQAAGEG